MLRGRYVRHSRTDGAFLFVHPVGLMRQFVVVGHDAPTSPEFSLDDLAGGAGRLDVLCRCVNSAFFTSYAIREDVRVHLVLGDEFAVRFEGGEVRRLNPDERSTAALVRTALEARDEAIGAIPANPAPGVYLDRRGFRDVLDAVDGPVVQLHEDGDPVVDRGPIADPVFVLSDHLDLTDGEESVLQAVADARVSLSPERLHADHAIVVAHNWLDTEGFERY